MNCYDIANQIYSNNNRFKQISKPVTYEPVNTFIERCHNLLNLLSNDAYTEISCNAMHLLFRLKNTIVHALQPFNSDSLQLQRLLSLVSNDLKGITDFQDALEMLLNDVYFLINNPLNPKYDFITQQILPLYSNARLGVITPCYQICGDDWFKEWKGILKDTNADIHLIRTLKELHKEKWNVIIMPFGGKRLSFLNHIYKGYHSETLYVVRYKKEKQKEYEGPAPIIINRGSRPQEIIKSPSLSDNMDDTSEQQELLEQKFRMRMLKESVNILSDEDNAMDYYVPARLVLLSGNKLVYLDKDKTEMVLNVDDSDNICDTFSRKKVSQLREGEYIVLRTGTNSDLVKLLADKKMEEDHISTVSMLDWKDMLRKSLVKVEISNFEEYLKQSGLSMPCPNYIKAWAGDMILRPGTQERFETLLKVMKRYGVWESPLQPEELARIRWKEMLTIVNYHRQAGFYIRKILLDRLSEILSETASIGDELVVDLDDAFPGASISLLRVVDIDDRDENIIANRVGRIIQVEDDSLWQ